MRKELTRAARKEKLGKMRRRKYLDTGCEFSRGERNPSLQIIPSRIRIHNSQLDTLYLIIIYI